MSHCVVSPTDSLNFGTSLFALSYSIFQNFKKSAYTRRRNSFILASSTSLSASFFSRSWSFCTHPSRERMLVAAGTTICPRLTFSRKLDRCISSSRLWKLKAGSKVVRCDNEGSYTERRSCAEASIPTESSGSASLKAYCPAFSSWYLSRPASSLASTSCALTPWYNERASCKYTYLMRKPVGRVVAEDETAYLMPLVSLVELPSKS